MHQSKWESTTVSSGVLSVYSQSSASGSAANNYADILLYASSIPSLTSYVYALGSWGAASTIQWLRTHAYPPNGIMPAVIFSGLS